MNSVNCDGDEQQFNNCKMEFSSKCPSGLYASVYCSNSVIVDTGNMFSVISFLIKNMLYRTHYLFMFLL